MKTKTNVTKKKTRTRDSEKTRAHILNIAFMEIYRNSFQGVSVDQIVSKAKLTKGAFFHHFPTKQDLGYALVDETLTFMTQDRWIDPVEKFEDPVEGILSNLKTIIQKMSEESLSLGCPLNNLVQEMSAVDPVFRRKLTAVLEFWIDGVEGHLIRAKRDGFLKKDVNVRHLAEFIVMNHEGAFGMTKSYGDRKLFLTLHASLKKYLESVRA